MLDNNFYTIPQYIERACSLVDKIKAIDVLIAALMLKTLEAVDSSTYDEYSLNDGQMQVKTKYRSINDVFSGITALEKIKQMYVNQLNGRTTVLRSGNMNFRGGCF